MSASKPRTTATVVAAGALVVLAVIALVVRAALSGDPEPSTVAGLDEVTHVHGLGINPADGDLYAATHYGLFRIRDDGQVARVGAAVQDTMGFTVVGPDHFLASGHPDPNDERLRVPAKPPLLGLIESTDGGRTWRSRSLLGEADFHSLVAAHDMVYGYDATGGRLMVSADGEAWDSRSELPLGSFAVDPADAEHLVATTPSGLAASTDGGRSWSQLGGPALTLLTWHASQGLWGVDGSGQSYEHVGQTWQRRGSVRGSPQAVLATEGELNVAVDGGGRTAIYRSVDRGRTWQLRYGDRPR